MRASVLDLLNRVLPPAKIRELELVRHSPKVLSLDKIFHPHQLRCQLSLGADLLPRAIQGPRGTMWVGPGLPAEPMLSVCRSMSHGDHYSLIILLGPIILGPALNWSGSTVLRVSGCPRCQMHSFR